MLKKAVPYLITFGIAVLAIALWPKIQPQLAKLPVIGSLFAATI